MSFRKTGAGLASLWAVGALAGASPCSAVITLYDVDFSSDQTGTQASTGSGSFPRFLPSPSEFGLGPGRVVESAGALDDKPMLFEQQGNGDVYQAFLDLPVDIGCDFPRSPGRDCPSVDPVLGHLSISFDLSVLTLAPLSPTLDESRFAFLLDTSDGVRRLDFASDGAIAIFRGLGDRLHPLTIGRYEFMKAIAVMVNLNLELDEWSIFIDGNELYRGSLGGALFISTLRFGLGTKTPGAAAIDNILVAAIPEPTSIGLLGLGLGFLSVLGRPTPR